LYITDAVLDETLEHPPEDRGEVLPQFAAGATLGHFRIVRELGAGGMGVVFEAYDPALDRSVAIKLVRDRTAGSVAGDRLIREAQAMAKLAHPNVIPVHEVDTIDGNVYVVMELVRGETLEAWLETPRGWREIVRAFVEAGQGLAAAHAAGLVHRDFKPSNVLVDRAGHVRVGDFGLARDDGMGTAGPRLAGGTNRTRPAGTPGYMAPEQRAGAVVDARADQYSFAVSLDRALTGKSVPRRIRLALGRALRVDRDDRFPTIIGLLDELRHALDARRRMIVVGSSGIAVAAVTTAIAAWTVRPHADTCADSAAFIDALWSPTTRTAIATRFAQVRPGPQTAAASTLAVVDRWARAWSLGRQSACRAEPERRPARVSCLDRGLAELDAQLATWRTGDADTIDHSLAAAASLPDPAACVEQKLAATQAGAAALSARIAAVNAAGRGGKAPSVRSQLDGLIADAGTDPALLGPALLAAADIERDVGELTKAHEHAAHAAVEAGHAGDDDTMLRALVMQASLSKEQGRPQDGLGLLDAADAVLARANLGHRPAIALARADALTDAGRYAEAIAVLDDVVAELEPRAVRDPAALRELASALGSLASAHHHAFNFRKSRELLLRTLEIETSILGADHPEVGKTLHDLAGDEARLGNYDKAREYDHRAREVFIKAYGEHNTLVVVTDMSLANIELQQGHTDVALPMFENIQHALTGLVPADHPYVGIVEESLGSIARDTEHCADAIPHFERAVAINEKAGRGGTSLAIDLTNLGACQLELEKYADSRRAIERAKALYEEAGVPLADTGETYAVLAEIEDAEGHRAKAIALAKQLVAAFEESPTPTSQQLLGYVRGRLASWTR
jgi:tetratricopeptide (TPR) repeat protein